MDFIIENWTTITGIIVIISAAFLIAYKFTRSDKAAQLANLKEWLLYATALAEKELGSGTGQLKLRFVYDMFVAKFSWLAQIISFEQFSVLVDEALEDMNHLLTSNGAVQNYIYGETTVPQEDDPA